MCKKFVFITIIAVLMGMMSNLYAEIPSANRRWVVWSNDAGDSQFTVSGNWVKKDKNLTWFPGFESWQEDSSLVPSLNDNAVFDVTKGHTAADHSIDFVISPGQAAYCYDLFGPSYMTPSGYSTSLTMTGGSLYIQDYWYWADQPANGSSSTVNLSGNSRLEVGTGDIRIGFGRGGSLPPAYYTGYVAAFNMSGNAYLKAKGRLWARKCTFNAKIEGNSVLDLHDGLRFSEDCNGIVEITENATVNCFGKVIKCSDRGGSWGEIRISGGTVNAGLWIGEDGEGVIEITGGVINGNNIGAGIRGDYPGVADPRSHIIIKGGEAHFDSLTFGSGEMPGSEGYDRYGVLMMKGGMLEIKGEDGGIFGFPFSKRSDLNLHAEMQFSGGTIKAGGATWICADQRVIKINVTDADGGGMFAVGGDDKAYIDMLLAQGAGRLTNTVGNPDNAFRLAYMPVNGDYEGITYLGITHKDKAWGPLPYDGQKKSISDSVNLKWNTGNGIIGQKLYAGTNQAALPLINASLGDTATSYTLNSITPYTVYYWRIDTMTSSGTVTGDVWEFGGKPNAAANPNPANNGTQTNLVTGTVSWTKSIFPGLQKQHVYLGTAADTLAKISGDLDNVTQTFNTGPLVPDTAYYWRIDSFFDVFPAVPVVGDVWKFKTTPLAIDGFETYTDYTTLHNTWKDGDTDFTSGAYINLTEDGTRVHSGSKSAVMSLFTEGMELAMVSRPIPTAAKNWTDMQVLTLYFLGDPGNAYPSCYANLGDVSKLYAAIDDDTNPEDAVRQYYNGDANDMFVYGWHEWNMPLAGFTGINLTNVQSLGIGADVTPAAYGPTITIDDIVLRNQICPSVSSLAADVNNDCIVDSDDLSLMSDGWLRAGAVADIYPAEPDNNVDLRDYSVLGSEWLAESLVP